MGNSVKKQQRSPTVTAIAALLAALWIAAGIAATMAALTNRGSPLLFLLSPLAVCFGLIWILVMLHGRQLSVGELIPGLKALVRLDLKHFCSKADKR